MKATLVQLKILDAIYKIDKRDVAVSKNVAEMTGKNISSVARLLLYYWRQGYLKKKPTVKKNPAVFVKDGRKIKVDVGLAYGCEFNYALSKTGMVRYEYLKERFGYT